MDQAGQSSAAQDAPAKTGRGRKILRWGLGALVVGGTIFFAFVPDLVGRMKNATHQDGPWALEAEAEARHDKLFVVDLHADSLLWDRDLQDRAGWGHLDLPRMREGNLALQGLTVVTKVPKGMSFEKNRGDSDSITALMVGQLRAPATWTSLEARALSQAEALAQLADEAEDFVFVRDRADLERLVDARAQAADPSQVVGAWLGLEGSHALEGDIEAVDRLFAAGYRMLAPVHFFDNELGGSAHGWEKGGLSDFGKQVIARQESLGMVVDLAHGSPALIDDVLAISTRPVVNSHTGVKATCDSPRNLSDAQLRGIAETGGVIGIAFFEEAVCGKDVNAIVDAILHAVKVVGADHVAFGSDFDGAVAVPFDASAMGLLTEALRSAGLSDEEVAKISGGNTLRVLRETLPAAGNSSAP